MYCRKCGKEIDDRVSFCRFCGTKVEEINNIATPDNQNIHPVFNVGMEFVFTIISFVLLGLAIANVVAFFVPIYDGGELTLLDHVKDGVEGYATAMISSILSVGLFAFSFNKKNNGAISLVLSFMIAVLNISWINSNKSMIHEGASLFDLFEEYGAAVKIYIVCGIGIPICGLIKSGILALVAQVNNPSKFVEGIK